MATILISPNNGYDEICTMAKILKSDLRYEYIWKATEYNNDQQFMEGFSYFDSVLDISPDSHAADEIRRLATELVDYRL